ncbi:cwl1 [Ilyonectria robusta]
MSVTEFASRSFGPNTFLARLRPKEYQKVPESTLNATLKDIHDLVQYAVVQVQRIIFGQDLDKTFAVSCSPGYGSPVWVNLLTDVRAGFPQLHRLVLANQSRSSVLVSRARPDLALHRSPHHFDPGS